MSLLKLRNLSKRYDVGADGFYAVRDVNLDIEQGEYVAIMGPSGSGKSTMMHLMGLLDGPTTGEIWIADTMTASLSERQMARVRNEKIGFVFQSFNLLPRTSAIENVAVPLWYGKISDREALKRAELALQRVGLDPLTKGRNHPNQLSGGQQQRVAIARAIVTGPSIIFADEPTGNLDSHSTAEVLALFQSLNDEGTTIVMVTHENEVAQHTKRIIRFWDGQIESDNPVPTPLRGKEGAMI